MKCYSLTHLADHVLLRDLSALVTQDRVTTAGMLAHLAEVDARRLYAPAAYPSMHAYCVGQLRISEDVAWKRMQAAHAARDFPAIFEAVAEGRLHVSGVCLLAPKLTPENAEELLAAAENKTKAEIERLLAERFPQADVPTLLTPLSADRPAPGQVEVHTLSPAPGQVEALAGSPAPGQVETPAPRTKVAPLSPGRFALQVTIAEETHDRLRYAQALLGHAVSSGDLAQVLDRALDALIAKLEQRKFARAARSRSGRNSKNARYVPAAVRCAVWERDGGQCTFVSAAGHRCEARGGLEFDHVDPVACGGQSTTAGVRLRCRAHNQYAAECSFGSEFMQHKREAARDRAAARRVAAKENETAGAHNAAPASAQAAPAAGHDPDRDVVPWLRRLGFRMEEARRAAELCDGRPDAPLEERVRLALSSLAPASARKRPQLASRSA
jgi:hypothetical protein